MRDWLRIHQPDVILGERNYLFYGSDEETTHFLCEISVNNAF